MHVKINSFKVDGWISAICPWFTFYNQSKVTSQLNIYLDAKRIWKIRKGLKWRGICIVYIKNHQNFEIILWRRWIYAAFTDSVWSFPKSNVYMVCSWFNFLGTQQKILTKFQFTHWCQNWPGRKGWHVWIIVGVQLKRNPETNLL